MSHEFMGLISASPRDPIEIKKWLSEIDTQSLADCVDTEDMVWTKALEAAVFGDVYPILKIMRGKGPLSKLVEELGLRDIKVLVEKLHFQEDQAFLLALRSHLPKIDLGN